MKKYVKVSVYKAVLNSYEMVYGFECPLLGLCQSCDRTWL